MLNEPPHGSRAMRWGTTLLLLAAIVGGIWWLRYQKEVSSPLSLGQRLIHPYRLRVKLGLDDAARTIGTRKDITSLASLITLPHGSTIDARVAPLETQLWTLRAKVETVFIEPDGDLVLRISDGGEATTAEVPDPAYCEGSPFCDAVKRLRSELVATLHPDATPKPVGREAEIAGIGFAGLPDKLTRTGVSIYPALSVKWLAPSGSAR